MKNNMKINSLAKLLLLSSLLCLLVPGMSFAASGPDLKVSIKLEKVKKNKNGTYNFTLRGNVKNVGVANYVSKKGQQELRLLEGS